MNLNEDKFQIKSTTRIAHYICLLCRPTYYPYQHNNVIWYRLGDSFPLITADTGHNGSQLLSSLGVPLRLLPFVMAVRPTGCCVLAQTRNRNGQSFDSELNWGRTILIRCNALHMIYIIAETCVIYVWGIYIYFQYIHFHIARRR